MTWAREARRHAALAGVLGTLGSVLVLVGASQTSSPYTLKWRSAWWFGIGSHPVRSGAPRPGGLGSYLAVLAVLGGMALLGLSFVWLARLRSRSGGLGWGQLVLVAVCWTVPLLVVAPLFSNDVYTYAAQGQMMAQHLDPYRHGPAVLGAAEAFTRLTDPLWRHAFSPYGPLFLLLDEAAVLVSGHDPLVTVELLRLACLAGVWAAALGAATIARRHGGDGLLAALLVALNPLLLVHLVAGAHDDALMIGLLVLGLAAADGGRPWLGILLCALGAAVKAPAVLGCAYIGWSCLAPRAASLARRAVGAVAASAAAAAVLTLVGSAGGLGWGFVKGLSNAGIVRLWMSPSTGLGMALGRVLEAVGLVHGRSGWLHTITVTRGVGAVAAGVALAALLHLATEDGPVRATGLALLAVALLGSALWAWYLAWGVAVLAPVVTGRCRDLLLGSSAAASYLGVPVGSVIVGLLEPAGVVTLAGDAALAALTALVVLALGRAVLVTTRREHTGPGAGLGPLGARRVAHP